MLDKTAAGKQTFIFNPLAAKDEISRPENLTFLSPGPQGGYLGGSRPMLPCVTLCPLIT